MKIMLLITGLTLCMIDGLSEDVIITNTSDSINCKITKIDSAYIYFNIKRNGKDVATWIDKKQVKDIRLDVAKNDYGMTNQPMRKSITIGILEGGGSLVGADLEILVTNTLGIQFGAGFIGFGGGLNLHFKPAIRSSFISFQYWHQGVGDTYTQSLLGPCFVYRGNKWLTAQIGIGFALEKGPAFPKDTKQPPAMLTYAIGAYFPW